MITKLAWKNIWFKPLNTTLSLILLSASVTIVTLILLLQNQFEKQFNDNIDGVELVLGAKGSPLQLILSSVYQMDAPTGNIDYEKAKVWMNHPFVEMAVPLAFGDNYLGYRIVGTDENYFKKYQMTLSEGAFFNKDFEVVVGAELASNLGLKLGDQFFGTHGDAAEGEVHDSHPYTIVGIANPTGKVADNLILCSINSVWSIHGDHEGHDHDHSHDHGKKEITAALLKFKSKMAIVSWPRMIAQNTDMQVASPAIEINRLFSMFGIGIQTLQYLAYGIMLISGISIFVALYNRLKERKYEFALMRLSGASRGQMLWLVLLESMLLCLIGYFLGAILGRLALFSISQSTSQQFKMAFDPLQIVWKEEGFLFLTTILIAIIAAVIPAYKAYRMNISKTLADA